MIDYSALVSSVDEFPTLPTIYNTLMDVMANPKSTAADAAKIISQDQAAASKILKAANSPIYGLSGRVTNITQAIVFLGFDEVKNLVIALSIMKIFGKLSKINNFNPIDLWKHSIAVGIITRLIGKSSGAKDIENYFLAGILHDIGKLVFFKVMPEDYADTIQYARDNMITAREAEHKKLGITHTVIGELLAEKWMLPLNMRNSIRYHPTGEVNGEVDRIVGTVHIANLAAPMFGLGITGDPVIPKPNIKVWDTIKLPEHFFAVNVKHILFSYKESVRLLLKSDL
jgi:HD-like signal output (HDOD) protein